MSECNKYVFLHNQKLKPSEDFKDSYLLNGVSLYEVVRIISGKALFLCEHYNRLRKSAEKMNLVISQNYHQIKKNIQLLVDKNDCQDGNMKLVFNFKGNTNSFYAYFVKHSYPNEKQYKNGVRTLIHQAERPIPTAKVYNHNLRSKANELIAEAEIFEVILLNKLGNVTEGSRSNLFFIKDSSLYTAPDNEVLHGIVRSKVLKISKELEIPVIKKSISYHQLSNFDAAFLTGTSPMILPINRINSLSFDVKHPLLQQIVDAYQNILNENLV